MSIKERRSFSRIHTKLYERDERLYEKAKREIIKGPYNLSQLLSSQEFTQQELSELVILVAKNNCNGKETVEMIKMLQEKGADIHIQDDLAMFYAAENGTKDVVRYLHKNGVNINVALEGLMSHMMYQGYLESRCQDTFKYVCRHGGAKEVSSQYLSIAAQTGNLNVIRELFQKGVKLTDNVMISAAIGALKTDNPAILKFVQNKGGDISVCEQFMLQAAYDGKLHMLDYFKEQGFDLNKALQEAIAGGHIESIQYLYKHGVDVADSRSAAIVTAIKHGHLDIVKYLYERGVNLNENGGIALRTAAEFGRDKIFAYLYENGANIAANNYEAMFIAYEKQNRITDGFSQVETYCSNRDETAKSLIQLRKENDVIGANYKTLQSDELQTCLENAIVTHNYQLAENIEAELLEREKSEQEIIEAGDLGSEEPDPSDDFAE